MKKILLFVLLYTSFAFSQEVTNVISSDKIKVTYTYYPPATPEGAYETYLYIDENSSQFVNLGERKTVELDNNMRVTFSYLHYINNYNFTTQQVEENRILEDGTTLYAKWNNDLDWEITDQEIFIGKYKVRKATATSFDSNPESGFYFGKVIAWFCADIPIPSGPARYHGLPGLILKLEYEDNGRQYIFEGIDTEVDYQFTDIVKDNVVVKEDVTYPEHKNLKEIKRIQRENKKNNR